MVSAGELKTIKTIFQPVEQGEGDGAKVRRIIGNRNLGNLDPFLMMDLFNVKLPAGFPDHPHRGFETVTYMLSGKILHEDFKGHKGEIGPGDIQWMTAGRGIVHAEMPASFDEPSFGFQLWINLHAANKFCEPQYQEFTKDTIPEFKDAEKGMTAKVLSGEVFGVKGPIVARTPTYFIDFKFDTVGTKYDHKIPKGWNSMLIIYKGAAKVQDIDKVLNEVSAVPFLQSDADQVIRIETAKADTHIVLLAGQPLNEPIANYGPFVLTTQDQLQQAFDDFQTGKNGFENARKWRSEIQQLKYGRSRSL